MTYGALADVYDRFTDDFDYDAWTKWYLSLIQEANPSVRDICDCGCGTGSIAVRLARAGYRVTGTDLSEDMLRAASDKARVWGVKILFARQDMRALALPKPADAVICACDGVNYLTDPGSVRRFLESAYRALKPGGALAFDVSNLEKLKGMGTDCLYGDDREDETYLWMNEFDAEKRLLRMRLSFFVREGDGRYRKFEETHVQRAHLTEELRAWLAQAGFDSVRVYGADAGESAGPGGKRVYFACQKPRIT